jgi:hypothetical protein
MIKVVLGCVDVILKRVLCARLDVSSMGGSTSADLSNIYVDQSMQLTPEHNHSSSAESVANARLGMDFCEFYRYLSHVRFTRSGSFVRDAEWIGVEPVSLSEN